MKMKLSAVIISAFCMQSTFATNIRHEPKTCPGIASVQSVGVNQASLDSMTGWMALNLKNSYDTSDEWTFAVLVGSADDELNAISRANSALNSLMLNEGPVYSNEDNHDSWGCLYTTSQDNETKYLAVAITPAVSMISRSISKFIR